VNWHWGKILWLPICPATTTKTHFDFEACLWKIIYTSVHIDETEARQTKLGPEKISREIPNVGEDALRHLDEQGIIRIWSLGRIWRHLVGKVTRRI